MDGLDEGDAGRRAFPGGEDAVVGVDQRHARLLQPPEVFGWAGLAAPAFDGQALGLRFGGGVPGFAQVGEGELVAGVRERARQVEDNILHAALHETVHLQQQMLAGRQGGGLGLGLALVMALGEGLGLGLVMAPGLGRGLGLALGLGLTEILMVAGEGKDRHRGLLGFGVQQGAIGDQAQAGGGEAVRRQGNAAGTPQQRGKGMAVGALRVQQDGGGGGQGCQRLQVRFGGGAADHKELRKP